MGVASAGPPAVEEAAAFLDALDSAPPTAVTACRGWTAHEMVAHLASAADAFADQVGAQVSGRPVPEFGAWDVREPPYRAMDDKVLRRRLETAERRMSAAFGQLLDKDPEAAFAEVGWGLPIAELVTHMRQEFAIHRWDLIGDDELGLALLGQPQLIDHSVRLLGGDLLKHGLQRDPPAQPPFTVVLRCAAEPDLVVDVAHGQGSIRLTPAPDADNVIETDAAARLLILWGRRPADSRRVRSRLAPADLLRLQTVLTGY